MKRRMALFTVLLVFGCVAPRKSVHHEIRYGEYKDQKCDMFIKLDGEWVKFYEQTRDTRTFESPKGDYIVINDYPATKCCHVKVFDVGNREVIDLTPYLRSRLVNLSQYPWYIAVEFTGDYTLKFRVDVYCTYKTEIPVAEKLTKANFYVDIKKAIEEIENPNHRIKTDSQ